MDERERTGISRLPQRAYLLRVYGELVEIEHKTYGKGDSLDFALDRTLQRDISVADLRKRIEDVLNNMSLRAVFCSYDRECLGREAAFLRRIVEEQ